MTNRRSHHHEILRFPKGFLWGTATSAYQVEGNNNHSDWWQWESRGKTAGGRHSGDACDHYRRFAADFEFITKLHNNAHRLSIEWSRIQPSPDGWDYGAIEHYRQVLTELKKRKITTFVTLHHFTNPQWFIEHGGWLRHDAPATFAKYAEFAAKELGTLVDFWVTINEPMIFVLKGYFEGSWPPGTRSPFAMLKALHHLEAAHRRAYEAIHHACPSAKVGIAHNMFSYQLYRPHHLADRLFMDWLDGFWNHGFLNTTRGSHDFLGLNYYFHYRLKKFNFNFKQFFVDPRQENRDVSDIGWEVFAPGIYEALLDLQSYQLPIYITENGIGTDNDDRRVRYLLSYLKEVYAAIASGIDVRGYFYWSLLDNFEWEKGFGPRFGLVHVDYGSQRRTLKPSGSIYAQIARNNAIAHRLLKYMGHGIKVPRT